MSQLYTRTCSRARSMPQSERISLCSISMIIPGVLLRYEVRGQGLTMTNLEETKTSSTLLRPKDAVQSLRVPPPYQRNASPTSHSSPGSQTMTLTAQLLLPVRNLLGNWYRTMCLTSRHANAWSSGPNMSLNSPIPSGNIGDLELHFGAAKPAKTVETHGDWVVAWRIIFRATHFIFPHWEAELEEYNDYITSYFASIHPSTHSKVLNLDRAIWKHVGSVNSVSLNEFHKFRYLETRHLQGHGAGESSAFPKEKKKQRDAFDPAWRKFDLCHLWNDGKCNHQASACKYRHICELCQGPHRKGSCPLEKNVDA
jgi:hypothetical protein